MKTRLKISYSVLALLLGSLVLNGGFTLLNVPNDFAFYGGIIVLLVVFVGLPTLVYSIWRKKSNEDSQVKPTA
jgi:hypothetical protein